MEGELDKLNIVPPASGCFKSTAVAGWKEFCMCSIEPDGLAISTKVAELSFWSFFSRIGMWSLFKTSNETSHPLLMPIVYATNRYLIIIFAKYI